MKLGDIETIVRNYVNDAAADVHQAIIDAINHLSIFYGIIKFDKSQTTVANQDYLDLPVGAVEILSVEINGEFIKPLQEYETLESVKNESAERWHIANDRIELTEEMSTTGEAVRIVYRGMYTLPEVAVDTNVPDKFLELIYVGATFRYFRALATKVMTSRADYPDVTPKEIIAVRDQWKNEEDSLFNDIR